MRAYVFTDKALAKQAGRFVWLEIDTEKKQNAEFKTRFAVPALPTFFVVDPATERPALRWVGGATVPQVEKLLEDGRRAVAGGAPVATPTPSAPKKGAAAADAALARADAFYGAGKDADAAKAYEEALALAPRSWSRYGRTVESLLFAYAHTGAHEAAARLARDAYPQLRTTPSAANIAGSGLGSALELAADHPERQELVAALEADSRAVTEDPKLPVAADDRSGVYIALLDARKDAKDSLGAREVATRWAAFLEDEAEHAPNAEARTVFDSHRLSAYLALGEPQRAIPMLEASERELPNDYNPPARLAVAYRALKRWDDALAASDRALATSYGPRRLGILRTRADIYADRGDIEAARSTLEDALREATALPEGQRSEAATAAIKKKLDALPKS
jgi:tetratricopeptide (TPR) repeat protein